MGDEGMKTMDWNDHYRAVRSAACILKAKPSDIPGLWNAPGYPELTTGQMLQIASRPKALADRAGE